MNLIEQLGGYAQAKGKLESLNEKLYKMMETERFLLEMDNQQKLSVAISLLEKSLLEYRRQHNIYEFGDICKLKIKHDFGLYKFRRIEGDRACLEDRLGFAEFWINEDVVEHANDAEIQAGKRL